MVSDLFVGSNPIKSECVLSKLKLEEFNCLGEPPEDYNYEGYFSKLLLTVSRCLGPLNVTCSQKTLKTGNGLLPAY